MEIVYRNLSAIKPNPKNPRKGTKEAVEKLAESIKENPKFFEARPILLSDRTGELVIIGGERRSEAARLLGMETVPTILLSGLTESQEDEILIKDNTHAGVWDEQKLQAWGKEQLQSWDVKDSKWEHGLSSQGMESGDGYEEFVDKFKPKLTTDDCFTPPDVYDAVLSWIDEKIKPIKRAKVVRPFYPGGNYETFDYPKGCVVIDNPPFSIYSKIVRFYVERKINFFLFGPSLTLFSPGDIGVTYIVANVQVTYENGAVVATGFVTNLIETKEIIWVDGSLRDMVVRLQKKSNEQEKYKWPDNVVSSALLGKLCTNKDCALRIKASEAVKISDLDWCKENKKGLYGGGFILSDAAAERAAAERAAAERAAAEVILSERELEIIKRLNTGK